MNVDLVFGSGIETTRKSVDWSRPITDIDELWHTGKPQCSGEYIVVYNGGYWFAEYNCESDTFIIQMNGTIGFEGKVDKWCLFQK